MLTVKASDRYISRVSIARIPVKENQSFKGFGISVQCICTDCTKTIWLGTQTHHWSWFCNAKQSVESFCRQLNSKLNCNSFFKGKLFFMHMSFKYFQGSFAMITCSNFIFRFWNDEILESLINTDKYKGCISGFIFSKDAFLQSMTSKKQLHFSGHLYWFKEQHNSSSPRGQSLFPSHILPTWMHVCDAFLHLYMPRQTKFLLHTGLFNSSSLPAQPHFPSHTYHHGMQ